MTTYNALHTGFNDAYLSPWAGMFNLKQSWKHLVNLSVTSEAENIQAAHFHEHGLFGFSEINVVIVCNNEIFYRQ